MSGSNQLTTVFTNNIRSGKVTVNTVDIILVQNNKLKYNGGILYCIVL